ncbi:lanC-like protein 2 isoform X1 [Dermacentor albipictus]|uniref:lanC-like protein 2 isoform X1 n=2 Tax=Dermacentor albipictus TaxID=60249 RepID=UPI0031FC1893
MSDRAFENEFSDYHAGKSDVVLPDGRWTQEFQKDIRRHLTDLLQELERNLAKRIDWSDSSVYTGTTGVALMYMHLSDVLQDTSYLNRALPLVERQLSYLKERRFSFLCGDPGPLAIGADLYNRLGRSQDSHNLIKRLVSLGKYVVPSTADIPDELLYGRVGYLFALLYVRKHVSPTAVDDGLIRNVVQAVLSSGQQLSAEEKSRSPLMYQWHGSFYLGAAHGLAGIFYMLLQAKSMLPEAELTRLVQPSIDWLAALQYPSGNYPSSIGSSTDKLVHWCHGAPGTIHMLLLAHLVFRETRYLELAKKCADVIWHRGILKKGYGICHGTAGNGYAFLRMYQVTRDCKYLHRAAKFCEWCFDYGQHQCRIADRPFSLFEGMAGTIYFMADMLEPEKSAFPAFQLG